MPHVIFQWPHMMAGVGEDPQPLLWGKQQRLRRTSWHTPGEGKASPGWYSLGQYSLGKHE